MNRSTVHLNNIVVVQLRNSIIFQLVEEWSACNDVSSKKNGPMALLCVNAHHTFDSILEMLPGKLTAPNDTMLTDTSTDVKTFLINEDKLLSVKYRRDLRATPVSETVWTYGYAASIRIVMSVFVPELQVFEVPVFFFGGPCVSGAFCSARAVLMSKGSLDRSLGRGTTHAYWCIAKFLHANVGIMLVNMPRLLHRETVQLIYIISFPCA